jgi:hypothetical protein
VRKEGGEGISKEGGMKGEAMKKEWERGDYEEGGES